jgi:hypothetical protein
MALPIKQTPQLKGKDAERFIHKLIDAETQSVSKTEYRRAMDIFKKMPQVKQEISPARAR